MAKRGRKRTPTIKLIARGSKRAIYDRPKNEPVPVPGMPKPPRFLVGEAKKEWNRKAKLLHKQGTLTLIDGTAFAAYCEAYALYVNALKELIDPVTNLPKLTIETSPNGNIVRNPVLGVLSKARSVVIQLAAEFGMTPSGRAGINLPKMPDGKEDSSQSWLSKHNQGA